MDAEYDRIAEKYKQDKLKPWRTHLERYTLLRLAGDVAGKSVIDLACGEGYYTRALRQQGAAPVVGVDLSRGMIALAESEEARQPLGVEYRVGDVRALEVSGEFDLAFAAYLLNYARTAEELTQMCRAVARALRPGGRFVTANNNPTDPSTDFRARQADFFSRRVEGEWVEGAPIVIEFFLPEGSFEVRNYHRSMATMEEAFRAAGLREVRWHAPEVSPDGLRQFGRGYWADFLARPLVAFIECVK
jgi:2-polyprenyl-3-methyl-5-hydroxy-6-metoxy-1,4-benzoquinol methylase